MDLLDNLYNTDDPVDYKIGLYKREDLSGFYSDMASSSGNSIIPERTVECLSALPASRYTHYKLTKTEAQALSSDSRITQIYRYHELTPSLYADNIPYPVPSTLSGTQTYFKASPGDDITYRKFGESSNSSYDVPAMLVRSILAHLKIRFLFKHHNLPMLNKRLFIRHLIKIIQIQPNFMLQVKM